MPLEPVLSSGSPGNPLVEQAHGYINEIWSIRLPPEDNGAASLTALAEPARTGHVLAQTREPVWALGERDGEARAGVEDVAEGNEGPGLELRAACEAAGGACAVACEEAGGVGGKPPFLVCEVADFGEVGDVVRVEEVGEWGGGEGGLWVGAGDGKGDGATVTVGWEGGGRGVDG